MADTVTPLVAQLGALKNWIQHILKYPYAKFHAFGRICAILSLRDSTTLPNNIGEVSGPSNIVNMWKDYYCQMFNLYPQNESNVSSWEVSDHVIFTPEEVGDCVNLLPNGKSPGSDGLVGEHFKHASSVLNNLLASLISSMLIHGFMPEKLIESVLVPIIKNKCKSLSSRDNYRPIALSNTLTKIIERLILLKIDVYLWTLPNQFGFQKGQGTEECIFVLKELINSYLQSGSTVYCCFLDASKAFDCVNHDRLMNVLRDRGIPKCIVRLLYFWYSNQRMYVRWGCSTSDYFDVSNGVRQGGVLSPLLFNVYVNDLSVQLESLKCGLSFGNGKINHIMYADDVVLFAPSSGGLQQLINICEEFGIEADIRYNEQKTVCMNISKSRFLYSLPQFYLNGRQLTFVNSTKYLGHILTSNMSDADDIGRQIRSVYCRGHLLFKKFGKCTDFVKRRLFTSFCSSFYCCALWLDYPMYKFDRLRVAYNNSIRRFFCLPFRCSASLMYTLADIPSPKCIISKLCYSLYVRLQNSGKQIICNVYARAVLQRGSLVSHWLSLFIC